MKEFIENIVENKGIVTLNDLHEYMKKIAKEHDRPVILCGDSMALFFEE